MPSYEVSLNERKQDERLTSLQGSLDTESGAKAVWLAASLDHCQLRPSSNQHWQRHVLRHAVSVCLVVREFDG